jgi:hypothetical protein
MNREALAAAAEARGWTTPIAYPRSRRSLQVVAKLPTMGKKFALDAAQIKHIATGRGRCFATDMITVRGQEVGYMVRDKPRDSSDSGWQFFSGGESQAYLDDAANTSIYDVNTVANYDSDIIPYLDAPPGCSFGRQGKAGQFVQEEGDPWKPGTPQVSPTRHWPPPGFPLVEGEYVLTPAWAIHLPESFARRIEGGALVLWRPGLTMWLNAWGNDRRESQAQRLAAFKKAASRARFAEREVVADRVTRFDYRLRDDSDNGPIESLNALIFSDDGHLQMAVYFDDPVDEIKARQLVDRVVARQAQKS